MTTKWDNIERIIEKIDVFILKVSAMLEEIHGNGIPIVFAENRMREALTELEKERGRLVAQWEEKRAEYRKSLIEGIAKCSPDLTDTDSIIVSETADQLIAWLNRLKKHDEETAEMKKEKS